MHVDHSTIIWFVALIVAIILHEISHGVVAYAFGDTTAKDAGRLTLNPIPHIDPFGSIFLPALGALSGAPVIGWAKPVPVSPGRLHNQRRDMLFVSLAGPATNFTLAIGAAVVARSQFHSTGASFIIIRDLPYPVLVPLLFAEVNLFLGLFNFLPIPPLDGAALIERVLPRAWLPGWYKFRPFGILVIFLLVFTTHFTTRLFEPFREDLLRFVLT